MTGKMNGTTEIKNNNTKSHAIKLVIVIACFVFLAACFAACGGGASEPEPLEIFGIVAPDVQVRYDGLAHTVNVYNTLDGDTVYYSDSPNGAWNTQAPTFSLPAEYVIYYKVERAGYADLVSSARLTITRGILQGINADDATFIYDGDPHGVAIVGVNDGDTVEFSLDGESFERDCAVVAVGEYTVYYRVSNEYADFSDECRLTVLPDLSGRYIDTARGVINIDRGTAYTGGGSAPLVYGLDGKGTLGDVPFGFSDGAITVDGASYRLLSDGERVYRINADGATVYATGGDTLEISVAFIDGTATVTAGERCLLTVGDRNYCESASGEIVRTYESSDVIITVSANGDITDADIVLSARKKQTVCVSDMTILYDGLPHAPNIDHDGVILYLRDGEYTTIPPEFTDIGVYSVKTVLLADGYLPELATIAIEVVPDISGVYFDEHTVITVDKFTAEINGVSVGCEYVNGDWYIADKRVSVTADWLTTDGAMYEKTNDGLIVISFGGEWNVLPSGAINLTLTVDERITVKDERGNVLFAKECATAEMTVKLNGTVCDPVTDDPCEYIFGTSDLQSRSVTVIEIV